MVGVLIGVPLLLLFWFVKKREPTQREFAFWLLFLIPFGLMLIIWFEGSQVQDFWWVYLVLWLLAGGVLLEKPPKR
jgi:peptidoglycan/LPS O-acetylase OafA/YrhL